MKCRHCGVVWDDRALGIQGLVDEIFSGRPSGVMVFGCECPTCDETETGLGACEWCKLANPWPVIPGGHGDGSDMEVEHACYLRMQN